MIAYALLENEQAQVKGCVVTSNFSDLSVKLADLALQIDEKIYLENQKIDMVCIIRSESSLPALSSCRDNAVCFSSIDADSSFYCTPATLTQLSTIYKINYSTKFSSEDYNKFFVHNTPTRILTNKLMYVIDRLGIDVCWVE